MSLSNSLSSPQIQILSPAQVSQLSPSEQTNQNETTASFRSSFLPSFQSKSPSTSSDSNCSECTSLLLLFHLAEFSLDNVHPIALIFILAFHLLVWRLESVIHVAAVRACALQENIDDDQWN